MPNEDYKTSEYSHESGSKRILTSVGGKCPLGCIYCFVENEKYSPLPKIDKVEVEKDILSGLEDADIIQPSADVEFFLAPNFFATLEKLVNYGKSISFATKSKVPPELAAKLVNYHNKLLESGAILQIAVTITRLKDWQEIEHFAPSPQSRIESLKNLYDCGIPTTVAIRPMLPFTQPEEIEEIVRLTYKYTYGYLSGPIYLTPQIKAYMAAKGMNYDSEVQVVGWLPDNPKMEVILSSHLENHLSACASQWGLPLFSSNIEAVQKLTRMQSERSE
jgi:DNA repair photolyase